MEVSDLPPSPGKKTPRSAKTTPHAPREAAGTLVEGAACQKGFFGGASASGGHLVSTKLSDTVFSCHVFGMGERELVTHSHTTPKKRTRSPSPNGAGLCPVAAGTFLDRHNGI